MSTKMKLLTLLMMLFPLACNAANAEYLKIYLMQPKNILLEKIGNVDDMDRYCLLYTSLVTAGRLIAKGSASSLTVVSPKVRRAKIARLVGSASAENVLLR